MIYGIGIDITELKRIEERPDRLAQRILTPDEREVFSACRGKRKVEYLAGRFAAKEAYAKACGCGIGKHLSFQDMEILNTAAGKPMLSAKGDSRVLHISISHSRDYACAQVVIEDRSGASS